MQDDVQCCRKTVAAASVTTLPQPPVCKARGNAVVPFLPQKQKLQGCRAARHEVGTDLPRKGMYVWVLVSGKQGGAPRGLRLIQQHEGLAKCNRANKAGTRPGGVQAVLGHIGDGRKAPEHVKARPVAEVHQHLQRLGPPSTHTEDCQPWVAGGSASAREHVQLLHWPQQMVSCAGMLDTPRQHTNSTPMPC